MKHVLETWFGPKLATPSSDHVQRWFTKDPAFDAMLRDKFAAEHARLAGGAKPKDSPKGLLAAVIVLDQFSRNMFRDTPEMYATDALAVQFAFSAIEQGYDRELAPPARSFLYMPFMHSEELSDQQRCVRLFRALAGDTGLPAFAQQLDYAIRHRDIVARFGRFPHRNGILGRESTPEEEAFLEEPGSSF